MCAYVDSMGISYAVFVDKLRLHVHVCVWRFTKLLMTYVGMSYAVYEEQMVTMLVLLLLVLFLQFSMYRQPVNTTSFKFPAINCHCRMQI